MLILHELVEHSVIHYFRMSNKLVLYTKAIKKQNICFYRKRRKQRFRKHTYLHLHQSRNVWQCLVLLLIDKGHHCYQLSMMHLFYLNVVQYLQLLKKYQIGRHPLVVLRYRLYSFNYEQVRAFMLEIYEFMLQNDLPFPSKLICMTNYNFG